MTASLQSFAHNPVHQERTKHVEIDRHFIKEKVERESLIYPMCLPRIKKQIYSLRQCLNWVLNF